MSIKTTNPLTSKAEQSAVCRSSEGRNQGKASCIVLAISSVRSAVYRSLLKRERGRDPHVSNFFFYAPTGAANAYNTTDSHNLKPPLADTYNEETAAPQPPLYTIFPPSQRRATVIVLSPLCLNALGSRIWAISRVGRDLRESAKRATIRARSPEKKCLALISCNELCFFGLQSNKKQ